MGDELLDDFIRADRERGLGVYGIHLHREGHPPVERRVRSDDRVNLYSVSKTFTSVALGLAEAEGRLSLDDRLLDHFPELRPIAAEGVEAVTLRQLLTMSSGTSHEWFADQRIDAADLLHEIVAAPLDAAPGTRFAYTDSGPYAIGRVDRPGHRCRPAFLSPAPAVRAAGPAQPGLAHVSARVPVRGQRPVPAYPRARPLRATAAAERGVERSPARPRRLRAHG